MHCRRRPVCCHTVAMCLSCMKPLSVETYLSASFQLPLIASRFLGAGGSTDVLGCRTDVQIRRLRRGRDRLVPRANKHHKLLPLVVEPNTGLLWYWPTCRHWRSSLVRHLWLRRWRRDHRPRPQPANALISATGVELRETCALRRTRAMLLVASGLSSGLQRIVPIGRQSRLGCESSCGSMGSGLLAALPPSPTYRSE